MRIYFRRLSLKPMVIGHWSNQISCRGREIFVGSNLVLQWVPGIGKVVRGDTKMSSGRVSPSGRIWYCSGCLGLGKFFGETQKCHRVGFHRVCYRGVFCFNSYLSSYFRYMLSFSTDASSIFKIHQLHEQILVFASDFNGKEDF